MSFLKYFSFKNLGHYIAVAARDIVKAAPTVAKGINTAETIVGVAAASGVGGAAVQTAELSAEEILRSSNAALGYLADAATKVTAVADGTNTLTIAGLTQAEIQDYQAIASYFKAHAAANGVALPTS